MNLMLDTNASLQVNPRTTGNPPRLIARYRLFGRRIGTPARLRPSTTGLLRTWTESATESDPHPTLRPSPAGRRASDGRPPRRARSPSPTARPACATYPGRAHVLVVADVVDAAAKRSVDVAVHPARLQPDEAQLLHHAADRAPPRTAGCCLAALHGRGRHPARNALVRGHLRELLAVSPGPS